MNKLIAAKRGYLTRENSTYSSKMTPVPKWKWPTQKGVTVLEVWRSHGFFAQLVQEETSGAIRLSVNRTMIDRHGDWLADIAWEDLQRIKSECGLGQMLAVEVYPRDKDVVNVANMRHLFLMPADVKIGWSAAPRPEEVSA